MSAKKTTAAKKAPAKKASAMKAAATKTAAKKASAKKAAATKTTATKQPTPRAPRRRTSVADGISRAAAEPRTASPLLRATAAPATSTPAPAATAPAPAAAAAATPPAAKAPVASPEPAERRLRVVPDLSDAWLEDETPARAPSRTAPRSRVLDLLGVITGEDSADGMEGVVATLADMLRVAASAAGLNTEQAEEQVARTLAYLRRRASGDFEVDEFGFDEDFNENIWLPLLRPLYQKWFRVEVRGIENIPSTGGALIVANHSGTVPIDGLMTQVAVHDETGRNVRMLGANLVFELPFVGTNARRTGSTLASAADAERLLNQGEVVGVYPEGFKGVGKPFSERYKLQRFGRGGFVSAALRTGVPIIPCSIVGAEEIYPLIGNIGVIARLMGAPYFPVTPFFPLLGPLGLIPLPSKWIIAFGPPVDTASIGPAGAEDPMLVFDLTDQVRETIQQSLYALLMQRRSVFF